MNIDIINEYCFMKHNILPGTQKNSITDVARNHLGLHSARIMTPYTTLCSRLNEYTPIMLTSQLYTERNLIKMRCMRTTLHMVPFDIASILHMATLDLRLADCKLFFNKNSIPLDYVIQFKEILIDFVDSPKTGDEIEASILENVNSIDENIRKEFAKKVLKYFWEVGLLCYTNSAESWEKEDRKYALTEKFYPDVDLNQLDIATAQEKLILEYIDKFGPATIKDIAWWSGLSIKNIRDIIKKNADSIKGFKVNNSDSEFYISILEYPKLKKFRSLDIEWVTLLAYEDPSLKGYYESRFRYVDGEYYNLLFNQIGEVRASIICKGKSIGIWEWNKKNKLIDLNYFDIPNSQIKKEVKKIKEKFECMLHSERQITLFDNCFKN